MLLAVKEDETGYEPIESKGVFYGLRKDGAKLLAESGNGTFIAKDYPVWFITLPGVDFSIGPEWPLAYQHLIKGEQHGRYRPWQYSHQLARGI
jgi:hypothetical protein